MCTKHRWSCLPDNEKFQSEIEHYENMEVMFGWTLEHLKNFEYEFMDPALDILMYMRQILTSCIRLESESKVTNYLKMNWQTNLENLLDVGRARVRELQEYEKLLRAQIAAIRMGNQGWEIRFCPSSPRSRDSNRGLPPLPVPPLLN